MLSSEISRDLLQRRGLTQQEIVLIGLATQAIRPKTVAEVRRVAAEAGLRQAWSWNISSVLAHADGRAHRTTAGWELTLRGWETVRQVAERHLAETVWREDPSVAAGGRSGRSVA